MGILNTLLTGGTIVGKICQSLTSALSATDAETGITVALSNVMVGGVRFVRSNADGDEMCSYAVNSANGRQSVSFPNIDQNGGGANLLIKSLGKVKIDNFLAGNVSPDANVVIGPTSEAALDAAADDATETLRISVSDLTIGGAAVIVGYFVISCTEGVLSLTLNEGSDVSGVCRLSNLSIKGKNKIMVSDFRQHTATTPAAEGNAASKYEIDLPFKAYGFSTGEVITEMVFSLEVTKAVALRLCDSTTQLYGGTPLHPVELKLIEALQQQLNKL